jgi:hypothetical protein
MNLEVNRLLSKKLIGLKIVFKIFKLLFMKAEIYDKVSLRFKVLVAASIGILATVIALGEMGII